ncbi:anterior gradient protein 2 homolog [Salarias fasciatus]|uniref:anterior gradient protein 2 homolog n=1 Tax=Salarias fasciatus TaxID=181472 RepID=UPI001176C32E|nr:anterior gradient protein 2 homolog [Salarias fasciatus]
MTRAAASLVLVLVALSSTFTKYVPKSGQRISQSLSRGWGDQLNWVQTYEEALSLSRSTNKPLMVLFHLEDCSQCDALKQALAHDDEIQRILDEDFVVLNVIQETEDQNLSPDGKYVPRIVFVDPSTTVRDDIVGPYSNRLYTYEPTDMKHLLENMKKAKKLLKVSAVSRRTTPTSTHSLPESTAAEV